MEGSAAAEWWAGEAEGPQGPRAQAQPSLGLDPWRGVGEGVGGQPPACWLGPAQGSLEASEVRQGRDRGTDRSGSSEPLPAITCLPGHLRGSPMGIKASVPCSHLSIPLTVGAFPVLTSERCPFSAITFVGFPFDVSVLGLLGPHVCSLSSPRNPSNTSQPSTSTKPPS